MPATLQISTVEMLRIHVFWNVTPCQLAGWPDLEQVVETSDSLPWRV